MSLSVAPDTLYAARSRYNHGTFESVSVTKRAYIDHRQSWLSPRFARDESRPINRRSYQELLFTGRQWMREGEGGAAAHASSRANSVAPSLFYHGSGGIHTGRHVGSERMQRSETRIEREICLLPDLLTWPPSVRLTVDQSIYLA